MFAAAPLELLNAAAAAETGSEIEARRGGGKRARKKVEENSLTDSAVYFCECICGREGGTRFIYVDKCEKRIVPACVRFVLVMLVSTSSEHTRRDLYSWVNFGDRVSKGKEDKILNRSPLQSEDNRS